MKQTDRSVIKDLYKAGATQTEIAELMGISRTTVRNAINGTYKKTKKYKTEKWNERAKENHDKLSKRDPMYGWLHG